MPTEIGKLLALLANERVDFILVGGVAGNVHGAARMTFDVDVVYSRTRENIRRIVAALRAYSPYLRGAPPGLPFVFDERTVRNGLNFTLTTTLGDLDLLGEIAGGGTYENLLSDSIEIGAFGVKCRCVSLERLISLKRSAGRPKDLESIAELETLREERAKS